MGGSYVAKMHLASEQVQNPKISLLSYKFACNIYSISCVLICPKAQAKYLIAFHQHII